MGETLDFHRDKSNRSSLSKAFLRIRDNVISFFFVVVWSVNIEYLASKYRQRTLHLGSCASVAVIFRYFKKIFPKNITTSEKT